MEGIDHIDIVEVRRRRLVGQVDRMVQRQVPDRECLEFRVPGIHASLVLVVQLTQAGRHFAAARSRRGHYDKRP